ncbi:MAG: ABC transporter ATP-binding protein [Burkholderiales bacterium]
MSFVEIRALDKRFGSETAVRGFDLSVRQGEFVTLLGPSGCGKTTTLRCIAGLENPDGGEIAIGGRTVASQPRALFLAPEQRNIGMVFQSYAVWPHMTVFDNVAYGLRVRRTARAEIQRRTREVLERVGLAHLAYRYANRLSGGQRQRVALARAIVYQPEVILFDEPLSNLDAKLREQLRDELARLQREVGITSIYVTHDQTEALVMSDRIVVMDKGIIQQIGDPKTLYARPANAFVANFLGVANLLQARLIARDGEFCELEVAPGEGCAPLYLRASRLNGVKVGQPIILSIRPEDLSLHLEPPDQAGNVNVIEARIIDTVYPGNFLDCRLRLGRYELGVQIDHFEQLAPDQRVYLNFQPQHGVCLSQ